MKKDIHPTSNELTTKCSTCEKEHVFKTTSTKLSVDVCSSCHPFYTGNSSLVKATGRVERFNRMFNDKTKDKK